MNKKSSLPYLTRFILKLAPKLGARVVIEPEWKIAGQIIYKNGVVRSLHMYALDLNNTASSRVAKDKDFAKFFMKEKGYKVAEGTTIFEKEWAKNFESKKVISVAPEYAKRLGYPVIVKPNGGTHGDNLFLVWNKTELQRVLQRILKKDNVALIERYMPGRDYRIVVLDGEIISAYERVALSVVGDGENSIQDLLKKKQRILIKQGRDTNIDLGDLRIKMKLKKQGYTMDTIPAKGNKIYLLDNANLSSGGDAIDVTKSIHPEFRKIAINLTKDMGLRMAGVDIMLTKGDITKNPKKDPENCDYYIIEINSSPGLDHYVTTGAKQKKIVEAMYLKVLKALGKKD